MATYPLILTFSEVVRVADGVVRVHGDTPVLAFQRDGQWVCAAASAGGLEETGGTLVEAYQAFRVAIHEAVEDSSFSGGPDSPLCTAKEFEEEIRCVFSTRDPMIERQWFESLEELRAGQMKIGRDVSNLPRLSADSMQPVAVTSLPAPEQSSDGLARAA